MTIDPATKACSAIYHSRYLLPPLLLQPSQPITVIERYEHCLHQSYATPFTAFRSTLANPFTAQSFGFEQSEHLHSRPVMTSLPSGQQHSGISSNTFALVSI